MCQWCSRYLTLSTNNIEKISSLSGLDNLKTLSLGRNQIKKIENLDSVAETLEELWISYNLLERLVRGSWHRLHASLGALACAGSVSLQCTFKAPPSWGGSWELMKGSCQQAVRGHRGFCSWGVQEPAAHLNLHKAFLTAWRQSAAGALCT